MDYFGQLKAGESSYRAQTPFIRLDCYQLLIKIDRHVAGLGALATILAVAFDPFNQNLIHYYQANIEDKNQLAYLANASSYDNFGPMVGGSGRFDYTV